MNETSTLKMIDAETWLQERDVHFERTTPHQLKIGLRISYYPGTGSVYVDRESRRRPCRGLNALAAVLQEHGYLSRTTNPFQAGIQPNWEP